MNQPVFIVGVPRSGTTLLRILLDSHPNITCGPETPWICGAYGSSTSLKKLYYDLTHDEYGPVKNYSGIDEQVVGESIRNFVYSLMEKQCVSEEKKRWIIKTPTDITQIPFLHKIFPDALFIQVIRDGRDVACSTVEKMHQGYFGKKFIYDYDNQTYFKNTRLNALKRWADWNRIFEDDGQQFEINRLQIKYETLVKAPQETLEKVLSLLDEPWSSKILHYSSESHIYPNWEAGSHDVQQAESISDKHINRWKNEFSILEKFVTRIKFDKYLNSLGYESTKFFL